jgi:hypothetical protein
MVYRTLTLPAHASRRSTRGTAAGIIRQKPEHAMYAQRERSCWGPAKWTFAAFLCVAALVYLLGGADTGKRPVAQASAIAAK